MSSDFLRFSALALFLSLLAGCGGSPSSGSGGTGGNSGGQTDSTTITYTFTGAAPTAVAVKIGTGDFLPATITNSELSFTLPDGTTDFAVAYACPGFSLIAGSTQNFEYLNYSSSQDGTGFHASCFSGAASVPIGGGGPNPTAALTGSVNSGSFPAASDLSVWASTPAGAGYGQSFNLPLVGSGFSASFLPPGTYNVVLLLDDSSGNVLAVKNAGNQTAPGAVNSGSTVDFGTGDATTFQPITYVNVPAGYSVPSALVFVNSVSLGTSLTMNGELISNANNQELLTQYSMLPVDLAQSGDSYEFESTASMQLSSSSASGVSASTILVGGGPATLTFPAPWSYAGPAPAALPTLDFSYTGYKGQSGLIYAGNLQWTPASGVQDSIEISLTPNYQSKSPSVTVPDLSTVPGFLAAPASGTTVTWSAEISNRGLPAGSSSSNTTASNILNSETYTVP